MTVPTTPRSSLPATRWSPSECELTVFNAEDESHAENVARADLGEHLADVPLTVKSVEIVEDEADGSDAADADENGDENEDDRDSDVLPEFEESATA